MGKMRQRLMEDGTVIKRQPTPNGEGYVYYIDGGPAGMVVVMDTYMTPLPIITACTAWELDNKKGDPAKPTFNFNNKSFRH